MTQIILIRHGETPATRDGLLAGLTDVELTDNGHEQAAALAGRLAGVAVNAVYASPRLRCLATAHPFVSAHGHDVVHAPQVAECDFGKWEGLAFRDIVQSDADGFRAFMTSDDAVPHGGESWRRLGERSWAFVEELAERHRDHEAVAVFTHGGPIRTIVRHALGAPFDVVFTLDVDPCSVTILRTAPGMVGRRAGNGTVRVRTVNDTTHLGDPLRSS